MFLLLISNFPYSYYNLRCISVILTAAMDHHRNATRGSNNNNGNHSKKKRRVSRSSSGRSVPGIGFGRSTGTRSGVGETRHSSSRSVSSAASRSSNARNCLRRRHNLGIAKNNNSSSRRSISSSSSSNSNSNNGGFRSRRSRGSNSCTINDSASSSSPHILCAIGENLARETCVVSLDLSAPFSLNVTKQSNGQSYSETIAYLSVLCPDEVLMNEGRYHSPLARKIIQHFDIQQNHQEEQQQKLQQQQNGSISASAVSAGDTGQAAASSEDEATVIKFISRSYFDQTKGADLLRRLARQDTYDSTLVEEYILLSSSHAVLHYTQLTLGAVTFAKHCLDVRVHTGGHNNHRMEIDRSTLLQLELLTNNSHMANGVAQSAASSLSNHRKHSLISTMDCTKTSVGHRLLRTTIMAPPSRCVLCKPRINH